MGYGAAAFVEDAVAVATVITMDTAMGTDMTTAMAIAMRLVRIVTTNLTVSPWRISAKPAQVPHVKGNQVIFGMRMATCTSAARQSQHMQTITIAVVTQLAGTKLAAARLDQSSVAVKCGSMNAVTSPAIVSK